MEGQGKNPDSLATRRRGGKARRGAGTKPADSRAGENAADRAADSAKPQARFSAFVEIRKFRDDVRAARIEELRAELREKGTLITPERIELAADRLARGESPDRDPTGTRQRDV